MQGAGKGPQVPGRGQCLRLRRPQCRRFYGENLLSLLRSPDPVRPHDQYRRVSAVPTTPAKGLAPETPGLHRTTFRYRCQVAWLSTGNTITRPRKRGIVPITRPPATNSHQSAMAPRFAMPEPTEND